MEDEIDVASGMAVLAQQCVPQSQILSEERGADFNDLAIDLRGVARTGVEVRLRL
jgi:hypothetical protein